MRRESVLGLDDISTSHVLIKSRRRTATLRGNAVHRSQFQLAVAALGNVHNAGALVQDPASPRSYTAAPSPQSPAFGSVATQPTAPRPSSAAAACVSVTGRTPSGGLVTLKSSSTPVCKYQAPTRDVVPVSAQCEIAVLDADTIVREARVAARCPPRRRDHRERAVSVSLGIVRSSDWLA